MSYTVDAIKTRIAKMRAGGVSDPDIRVALFREGWLTADIRQAWEAK